MKPKMIQNNLLGMEMIPLLRQGHMIRRKAWVDGYYIRICNEKGFDNNGNCIFDDHKDNIYLIATDNYFFHLGTSVQPFREPMVYHDTTYDMYQSSPRDGDGINAFFMNDWEDYGFITKEDFDTLTKSLKDKVQRNLREAREKAIEKAKAEDETI